MSTGDVSIRLTADGDIIAGASYALNVEVINTGKKSVRNIIVESVELPGKRDDSVLPSNSSELEDLIAREERLREEMRTQAEYAYLFREHTGPDFGVVARMKIRLFNVLKILSTKFRRSRFTLLPSWSRRSIDIEDEDDVAELDAHLLSQISPDHQVRKAWDLGGAKLKRIIAQIAELRKSRKENSESQVDLPVGSSTTVSIHAKAPRTFAATSRDAVVTMSYDVDGRQITSKTSARTTLKITPSPAMILTASMIGALAGCGIRAAMASGDGVNMISIAAAKSFGSSAILGLFAGLLVRKTPHTNKPITADDVWGGLLIGGLAGLFSDKMLAALESLVQIPS